MISVLRCSLLAATLKSFKIKELRGKAASACEKPDQVSEETDLPNDLPPRRIPACRERILRSLQCAFAAKVT